VLAVLAVVAGACLVSGDGQARVTAPRCPGVDLGTIAFVRDGALADVDLRSCRMRTLVPRHVLGPVRISVDGRYVAFNGGYVSSTSGAVRRTRGAGLWSPRGDVLAVGTANGGVQLIEAATGSLRTLLPDGWGATTLAFAPDGRTLAVSRSLFGRANVEPPYHQEIWIVDSASGRRRMIFHQPRNRLAPPWLSGFSPDGRWLVFWEDSENSASLAADGLPLLALRVSGGRALEIARSELHYPDFLTWCGNTLVFVLNHGGRQVTTGDGIAGAAAPSWRAQTILPAGGRTSWNSVACPTVAAAARGGGGLVVAGGPTSDDVPFGREHRSLWVVSPTRGARPQVLSQTVPPAGETDELPMWSSDGRWIVFVRTKAGGASARGSLYAIDPFGGNLVGPIAAVGRTGDYYGAYGWANQIDWHR